MDEKKLNSEAGSAEPGNSPEKPVEPIAIPQPTIFTKRLLLRAFHLNDAENVYELINDREIAAFTRTIPFPYPEDGASKWIKTLEPQWQEGKSVTFAVCRDNQPRQISDVDTEHMNDEQNSELIGAIGLTINAENENAELGYWIGRPYWNAGYCSEAARAVVNFGFEELQLQKIHAHHMLRNPASGRVLENIGMSKEGVLRKHIKKWGSFEDIGWFGILKSDWHSVSDPRE